MDKINVESCYLEDGDLPDGMEWEPQSKDEEEDESTPEDGEEYPSEEEVEKHLKSQGWEYQGSVDRTDSDAYAQGAHEVESAVNKGKTKVLMVVTQDYAWFYVK